MASVLAREVLSPQAYWLSKLFGEVNFGDIFELVNFVGMILEFSVGIRSPPFFGWRKLAKNLYVAYRKCSITSYMLLRSSQPVHEQRHQDMHKLPD